jgi:hypothetical protein
LAWNVTGSNSVNIDHGIGVVNAVGNMVVSPTASTVYTLSATNSAGMVTKSWVTVVNESPAPPAPGSFAVTGVVASTDPTNFAGVCPKTFTFYAAITANGPGKVTYIWESFDGNNFEYSDNQTVTFAAAGTQTTQLQWNLINSTTGLHRVHILTPNDVTSIPVYYELNCSGGSLVTGMIVGIDKFPYNGSCPKAINFWGTITTNGPGKVTYRWERSDGSNVTTAPETITFTEAGTKTVTNIWTRGEGTAWQRLHILTPDNAISSQVDFVLTCD